jgi:type I restriction enzyme S subunit
MELRKGYKQTELGIIPEDWEVKTFANFADRNVKWSITGGPFGSNLKTSDYIDDGIQIVQLQNIGDGIFNNDSKVYTSIEKANELIGCNIFPGDIILSKMGDPVARACFIPSTEKRYLMASDGIRLVVNEKEFSKRFVHDYINSVYFRKRAFEVSNGSTRLRIGLPELKRIAVIKPTKAEQTAIATALSDADAYIQSLEKLIEKKRNIKQGAMQELLKPKEGWVVKKLNELLLNVIDNRGKTPPFEDKADIELLETNAISFTLKYPDYSKVTKYIKTNVYNTWFRDHPKLNDILVSTVGEYSGASAIMQNDQGTIAQNLIALRLNRNLIDSEFVFYWFRSRLFNSQLKAVMMNQAQPSLRVPWLLNFNIAFPEKLELQKSIAKILNDIDSEINSLDLVLSKYRQLKQGMMQELLTGKIRLVEGIY